MFILLSKSFLDILHHQCINLSVMTAIPLAHPLKAKWFQMHGEHCFLLNNKSFKSIFTGDSLMAGLLCYCRIWNNFFKPIDTVTVTGLEPRTT